MSQPPGYPVPPGDPYGQPGQPPMGPPPGSPPPQWPQQQYPPQPPQQYPPQPPAQQYPPQPPPQQYPPGPDPYAQPVSGQPYAPPADPYAQPVSGPNPYAQPVSGGNPYAPPGGPYAQPVSGQPYSPAGPAYPTTGFPAADPYGQQPGFGYPGYQAPPAAPKKRGLLIAGIIVVVLLVLVGGGIGTFLLVGGSDLKGKGTPEEVVTDFLKSVFTDKNIDAANNLVCSDARDKAVLSKQVDKLKQYEQDYRSPTYSWTPPKVDARTDETATVTTAVKMTSGDDKVAEKKFTFITVKGDGWLVCEIKDGG